MSRGDSYFARLKNTLEGVIGHLTAKGIEAHHLAFGGEGEKRKTRVPTDANSEFLANRAMGDWAEQVLAKAINSALSDWKALPYGNSDRMAAGEEGFREFYLAGVEETRVHGKRPDLLLFDVKVVAPNDLSCLKHGEAAEFVGKAIAAIEVRSSKFEAQTYMNFRQRQRAAGKKFARETPSFTVKAEDLVIVYRWLEQNPLPQSYCQVFFDTAYAINFLDVFRIIASGVDYKLERPKKSQEKATIMIPITNGTQIGSATAIPTFAAEHRVTELGRHDAYVVPQGGGFELDAIATRKVLLAQS